MKLKKGAMLLSAVVLSSPAAAATTLVTGGSGNLTWTAQSTIVGAGSTATVASGGSPLYVAPMPKYSGVTALIMDEGAAGSFICSGTLVNARTIVTAGHCVSHGAGTATPLKTTAYFYNGNNPDTTVPFNPASTAVEVARYHVNPNYTGEVVDQNDIAVLKLKDDAPSWAAIYGMDFTPLQSGDLFNVAGYGARSDTGGNVGANLGTGRLRQGDNRYDFRFGDPDFDGFFTDGFFGKADVSNSWVSDFDNGLAANDASCRLAGAFGLGGSKYCNLGLGPLEVATAGGDSGGPQFRNGKLASVTSYGLSFGTGFGDKVAGLNSSFGEFNGYVPLYLHQSFITGVIPEPATWAMMIGGFGMVGGSMRYRRRQTKVAFATA